jgi:hypothetical protein
MDSGTFLLGAIGALSLGTVSLCGYTYVFYRFGHWIAKCDSGKSPIWVGILSLAVLWTPVAALVLLLPFDPLMRMAVAFCVLIVHGQPSCIGYWAGRIALREEQERRWRKNADDWLGTWECAEGEQTREDTFWN